MTDEAKTMTIAKTVRGELTDGVQAPFVFFDGAGPRGHMNGLIHVAITALRHLPAANRTCAPTSPEQSFFAMR